MANVYFYVVDRDFGFAPNPFHGTCTLATCKPQIRKKAQIGDWVIGMGGRRLDATGHCIFAMRVSQVLSFDEYWFSPEHFDKRPVRNGSDRMIIGDNIYHRALPTNEWSQADSHHSNPDGTVNFDNLKKDTQTDRVLISNMFFYFGEHAPRVPQEILDEIGFRNRQGHRVYKEPVCADFLNWLHGEYGTEVNLVLGDPFDFHDGARRYSDKDNRIY